KPQSQESLKAEVCPWELEPTNKAEICPWEAAAPPAAKEKSRQDKDSPSLGSKSSSVSRGLHKDTRDMTSAKDKASRDRQSVCPWERTDTELPPEQPRARSPVLPKSPSRKPQSQESLKAEVCPWELEPMDKAEICPWEAAAPPASKEKSKQDKDGLSMVSGSSSVGRG
ncbi:GP179 protein, partial [Atlantisia rogersi]|nr:GP179 protein [Atlantisia rogersi]